MKPYDTDEFGKFVTVVEKFPDPPGGELIEIFRGTREELYASDLPYMVKTKGVTMTGRVMSDSDYYFSKVDYSDDLRQKELDALSLASSRNKLNKVAESLAYDARTFAHVAFQMNRVVHNANRAGTMERALNRDHKKPAHEHDYITNLMGHAENPEARAAIATAYHNLKTSENRLN